MLRVFARSLCAVFLLSCIGCGNSDSGPALYPTKGTIKKGPNPLSAVSVVLVPDDTNKGITVTAVSGDDGAFEFTTPQGKKGAPAGSYKVVLSAPPSMDAMDYSKTSKPQANTQSIIPKEFTSAATSPKAFEVKAGGENVLKLELW